MGLSLEYLNLINWGKIASKTSSKPLNASLNVNELETFVLKNVVRGMNAVQNYSTQNKKKTSDYLDGIPVGGIFLVDTLFK